MAFWNAPLDDPAHGLHAVRSALEMRETLVRLNARMEGAGGKGRTRRSPRSNSASASTPANAASATWGPISASTIRRSATRSTSLPGSKARPSSSASTSSPAPRRATKRREFAWLEIDHVRLKNKTRSVAALHSGGRTGLCGKRGVPASSRAARGHSEGLPGAPVRRRQANGGRRRPSRARRHSGALPLLSEALRGTRPSTSFPRPGRR